MLSLTEELQRISSTLDENTSPQDVETLRSSLPSQWTIATPEQKYSLSTEFLRSQLANGSKEKAKAWAENLAENLRSYSPQSPVSLAASRAELNRILAEPEFGAVGPPSAWDLLRARINAWLVRLFARLFGGLMRYPMGGTILFWVVVVACIVFIGMWVFRFMVGRDHLNNMASRHIETASRTWQEWVRAARDAAMRKDFRQAVRAAYWAGITRLEDCGALPKDHTKTPREYLSLVVEPKTMPKSMGEGGDSYTLRDQGQTRLNYRNALGALTRRFEYVWYANRGANQEDFSEALRQLEALGCRLE